MRNDLIVKIEIQYFRSIYRVTVSNIEQENVFTGKNDVGKSNVLKALNLFFNNCIVKDGDYNFIENYNQRRLEEVRKDSIKGKQFIQIKVTFRRGEQSTKSLPQFFTVTKKWNRDSVLPQISDNVQAQMEKEGLKYSDRTKASLTRFLNGIKYVYVPAIKDEILFEQMIGMLQGTVYQSKLDRNEQIKNSLETLSSYVAATTTGLSKEFEEATRIESMVAPPTEIDILYKTFKIMTKSKDGNVSLENRGDGIRVRYIPSILYYVASNSSDNYIWGFEEPENSLEFNLARKMADDFYNVYSKSAQIFLTTHSVAFIELADRDNVEGFRCYKQERDIGTGVITFDDAVKLPSLAEELGYVAVIRKQYDDYVRIVHENDTLKEQVENLETEIMVLQKPVLLTEGKTDAIILNIAWNKLYDYECPFEIKSCNLMSEDAENAVAGAGILKNILCGIRYDSSNVIIGLFDYDDAGIKEFKLDGNYIEKTDTKWKKHKNGKGYALLIPWEDNLQEIAESKNLSIEYLFDKESMEVCVGGKKLLFEEEEPKVIFRGKTISTQKLADELWYLRKIKDNSKTDFAQTVVPSLPKEKFNNFKILFAKINEILEELE